MYCLPVSNKLRVVLEGAKQVEICGGTNEFLKQS